MSEDIIKKMNSEMSGKRRNDTYEELAAMLAEEFDQVPDDIKRDFFHMLTLENTPDGYIGGGEE